MSVHMQVSFVVTSLSAHCHSCMYGVLMCVEHTSDHDICLFKNITFVFSNNLNYNGKLKKEGWDLKQLGSWETEKTMSSHLKRGKGRDIKSVDRETIKRTKYRPVVYWK